MKRIGGGSFENRFLIVEVAADWPADKHPLPPPHPADRWFDNYNDFVRALDKNPWQRLPVRRVQLPEAD